ncbi:hypothetical protein M0R45_025672 [Rubus argutus]|uniref:Uncharacterized protein n=1 Tax=Rubus argutus TaxID=59490 RepID=A0AAW1WW34_RUBAR
MEASSSLREACMSDERGPPLPLPLHLGLPIMKRRRHHYQLSSKGANSLMFQGQKTFNGGLYKVQLLFSTSKIGVGRDVSKDDAGSNSTYLRWKEYQHDIAIDLAVPFHRGSLAGAMMSKGVYRWMYIYLVPLGHIVLNAVTQAMNVAEKSGCTPSAGGQAQQPAVVQHVSSSAVQ